MEVYAVLKINDSETGELLEKVDCFFTCDECESIEEFHENFGDEILEFLENKLEYVYDGTGVLERVDIVLLSDDYDDDDEAEV